MFEDGKHFKSKNYIIAVIYTVDHIVTSEDVTQNEDNYLLNAQWSMIFKLNKVTAYTGKKTQVGA